MRMRGGVRRFQTGGANPRAIPNPGFANVMSQMNPAAFNRNAPQPTSANSGWVSPSAPPGFQNPTPTPAQIAANQATDAQFIKANPSAAAMFNVPGSDQSLIANRPPGGSGIAPMQGGAPGPAPAPGSMSATRFGMPPPPQGGAQQNAFSAGAPGNSLGAAPGLNPAAIQAALQQRRGMAGGAPMAGGPGGAPAAGFPATQGMPPGMPPGGGAMGPMGPAPGPPPGMAQMGPLQGGPPQASPQQMAQLAAMMQARGATPVPVNGMRRGGKVKAFEDKAAEDIPEVEKKARGGAIKRRRPPAPLKAKKAIQPPPPPLDDESEADLPPSAPPAAGPPPMGTAPGMKKGGKWIQNLKKGTLHKQLGIPQDKKIPEKTLAKAATKGGKLGKRARAAETLKTLRKNKGGSCDKMASGGAMKVRRGFPNTLKAPKKLAVGGAVRLAKGGKVRGCGAATKGCNFEGIY